MSDIPAMGDNVQTIDYAAEETARLESEYGYLRGAVEALCLESLKIETVTTPESKELVMSLIKRQRDQAKSILGIHAIEKMPHFRRGQGVDQFFFLLADTLSRRAKTDREGEADRLNRLLTDYDRRVLAEEMERRRLANEEAERIARAALEAQRKAEALAEEARLKAERARVAVAKETKETAARVAEEARARANVEAEVAKAKAEEARISTLASAADVMRTRSSDGTLGTMATEPFWEVTDRAKLDLEALRPYFSLPVLQQALGAYARSVGFSEDASVQIVGASFGKRQKSRVR